MTRKKHFAKILWSFALCVAVLLGALPAAAAETTETPLSDDIVILYTNDVHTYIDGELSYDVIAALKKDLQTRYKHVLLVDAGDHIQGTAYGSMDKGENIVALMNLAGYDVATLGNHEFDYAMQGCLNAIAWADHPYISCNFYKIENGVRTENVLDSYILFDCGAQKIALVGITTPDTFSKSTPAYFQDENGNYIYGISGGDDGAALYQDVQTAIDAARAEGATTVIALGHLGVDWSSSPWTSEETIAATSGLDAFIDGHSHTVMQAQDVADKNGETVLLTQTGEYFDRIGIMIVDAETGAIQTDFIEYDADSATLSSTLYTGTAVLSDAEVAAQKEKWMTEIDTQLGQTIGFFSVTLDNYDADGNRLVRSQETNSGDFAADALYYLFDNMGLEVDIAVMNGGGTRNRALTGDVTYKTCKDMHPFGNVACLQTVTGKQILYMLEWGAHCVGTGEESGSFLQVSGLRYTINTAIPDGNQVDEMGVWCGAPDTFRVENVTVYNRATDTWDALDLDATYNLAGYNYILRDLGDGYGMLDGAVNIVDYVMEDYMVLANYISGFSGGTVDATNSPLLASHPGLGIDYSDINGDGRITILSESADAPAENPADSPKTADTAALWLVIALPSACAALYFAAQEKKKLLNR